MSRPTLNFSSRKALTVQLGEAAGKEIADLLQQLSDRIDYLERSKVDVTPIVRVVTSEDQPQLRRAA